MKKILLLILSVFGFAQLSAQRPLRTWTNQDGRSLEARMISGDGVSATVMTADARMLTLQLNTLVEADQQYVRAVVSGRDPNAPAPPRKTDWNANGEAVLKEAAELNLPILLLFTGSDWCPPCMRLEREVFEKEPFKEFANEHLVLQIADFPRRRQLSQSQQRANRALAEKHGIRGYPTMVLLDSKGERIAQFGYGGQSSEAFVKMLKGHLNQ
jgi:protein disulfide-isomerase